MKNTFLIALLLCIFSFFKFTLQALSKRIRFDILVDTQLDMKEP